MRLTLLLLTFVSALSCNAQIGADQARDIAARFFADNNLCNDAPRRKCARKDTMPKLVYTAKTYGKADYYVFHRNEQGNGFVIVNAHGTCEEPAVIGYAHEGSFDIDNIPPAFAWCLSQYQQCGIAWRSNGAAEKWSDVGPLLTTQWNQRKPFDGAIPVLDTDGKPFLTGCVATATAQIMKYHNCPQQGTGSNSYTFAYNDSHNGYTIGEFDADFSTTEYDWGNMLDIYDEGYSDTEASAVATLMYHVGVAGNAAYGTDMTGGSDRYTATALYRNFGYDKSIRRAERKYYTDEDWAELVYGELAEQRPVLYTGFSSQVGHTFVCDGYSDGLFHINWGWGGYCDGFFALFGTKALTPNGTGAGGGSAGQSYTHNQSIVYGIKPDEGGSFTAQPVCGNYLLSTENGGTGIDHIEIDRSKPDADGTLYYTYRSYDAGIYGYQHYSQGIMLRDTATGECYFDKPTAWNNYFPLETSVLPYNGTYEAYPAYTTDNGKSWYAMPYLVEGQTVPTITVTGGESRNPVKTYTLTDATPYILADAVTYDELTYTRTFNNLNWQALYVPFALNYEEWKEKYDIAEINNVVEYDDNDDGTFDRTYLVILKKTSGSTEPNYPYLIRAKETGTHSLVLTNKTLEAAANNSINCCSVKNRYTFTGTYQPVTDMFANGYYALNAGSLQKANAADVVLNAQRWFMNLTSRTDDVGTKVQTIGILVDGEEGIKTPSTSPRRGELLTPHPSTSPRGDSNVTYDLTGRVVSTTTIHRGVNIMNGMKVIR